jgi:peroxiredoxin
LTRRFVQPLIGLIPALVLCGACHFSIVDAQPMQLKLRTLAGSDFFLSDHQGAVVVLSFNSVRTPLAEQTIPALQRLADYYRGQAVKVYWVSIDSTQPGARDYVSDAALKTFVEQKGGRFTILRDPSKEAFNSLGLDALPTVVVIGREGQWLREYVGFNAEVKRGYHDLMETIDRNK